MFGGAFVHDIALLFWIERTDLERIAEIADLRDELCGEGSGKWFELRHVGRVGNPDRPWRCNSGEGCLFGHGMMETGICEAIDQDHRSRSIQMLQDGDPVGQLATEKNERWPPRLIPRISRLLSWQDRR